MSAMAAMSAKIWTFSPVSQLYNQISQPSEDLSAEIYS